MSDSTNPDSAKIAVPPNAINVVLWEALRETGADLSGYDGPEHWVAVLSELARAQHLCRAVRELRRDYEEALENLR